MAPVVKMNGRLPGDGLNGLVAIVSELLATPDETHVVIAVVDCMKTETDTDTGESVPHVRVRRVEVVTGAADAARARTLLTRAFETRTGLAEIPGIDGDLARMEDDALRLVDWKGDDE